MALDDLYAMPGHLIRRMQQASTAVFTEECGAFDITSVQYAALVAIGENPGVDATRLSAMIAFDRSTLGDVLERLEAKGWVARRPSASDRRMKVLTLSAEGARMVRRVTPAVERVQALLLAPLAPADRATFLRLLGALADAHNEIVPMPLRATGS